MVRISLALPFSLALYVILCHRKMKCLLTMQYMFGNCSLTVKSARQLNSDVSMFFFLRDFYEKLIKRLEIEYLPYSHGSFKLIFRFSFRLINEIPLSNLQTLCLKYQSIFHIVRVIPS